MNLNPPNHLSPEDILAKLKEMQNFFLKTADISENTNPPSSPAEPPKIHPLRIKRLHNRQNPSPKAPEPEMTYRGQLKDASFFYKFSESFNLMESFIKAQSANDLVIALHSLGQNLKANFQKERSVEMLKHLNSNEGHIFLKHKIDQIIEDTTQQILRDPRLNSPDSKKGTTSTDDDLTKSEGNIATQNESTNQPAEINPRDYVNSTDQKLSSVIELLNAFTVVGLKHSARDLLLGMDKNFSERLKLNPLTMTSSDRPFMIIDTAQDPKKSGIESEPFIKFTSADSSANQVINVPETLKSFTKNYILPKKINPKPVDKDIQPYLNKLINELDYKRVDSFSAMEFYLKAVQKGYREEANEFLTRAIQNKFKTFLPSDIFLKNHTSKEEFNELTDLIKWAADKKFLPKPDLQKTLLSLITETNKLKDKPNKLMELRSKYKLLESLFDKLHHHYDGENTVPVLIIADEIVKRFNNQQGKLEKSISTLEQDKNLLERSVKVDPSQVANYNEIKENEELTEIAPKILSSSESNPQTKTEPSKEDVLQALKRIYIEFELSSFDKQENNVTGYEHEDYDEDYDEDDEDYYDEEDYDAFTAEDYADIPLELSHPINFLDEIPSLFEQINEVLNASLDQEKIKAMGIDLTRITAKDLELKSIGTVINEAFLEFKQERLSNGINDPINFLNDEVSSDRFNNIVLKKLIKIQEEQPNTLRFVLKTHLYDLVDSDENLKEQDLNLIVDFLRLPEIFVNRETEFYKNAPNREPDGSFKLITDEKVRNKTIEELINFFDKNKHSEEIRELTPESKTSLNEIIRDFGSSDSESNDYSTTEPDRIAFLYFSLLENNLKREANIILYNSIEDTLSENSKINTQRLVSLLPVLKYAKDKGYTENFKNGEQEINFNKFNHLLQYSSDQNNEAARKYAQQDYLDKIENPKISHQEILQSLELSCSDKNLNPKLISDYRKSLLKRLLPDEELLNRPLYLENNLPDLIRLATAGERLHLLNSNNLETFKRQFQAEDLVRLTPTELVKDFFKSSSNLRNALESSIENNFKAIQIQLNLRSQLADDPSWIKILNSNTHLINNLESLVDKAFSLDNQNITQRLTIKLREEIPSLEINPDNAAAHLSLLNCILNHTHDLSNQDANEKLKAEYSEYLDLPLGLKENLDEPVDLRIMLIPKMEEALQFFEKFLKQNKTLKRDDFPQSYESESILKSIGLPLYS